MLSSIVRYVAGYLTGGDYNDSDNGCVNEDDNENQIHAIAGSSSSTDDEDIDEEEPKNGGSENSREFNGVVTSFFNNRGLINDEIYFTKTVVIGSDQPKIGDNVFVKASRAHAEGGWVATSVQITCLWPNADDFDNSKPSVEVIIGSISDVSGNIAHIQAPSTNISVSLRKFKAGYKPYRGDLVSVELWREREMGNLPTQETADKEIVSISPLREKKIHGTVTEICHRYGFINDNVYFSFAACRKGSYVHKGDSVVATLIESKQQRGDWRALYVEQKKKPKESKTLEAPEPSKETITVPKTTQVLALATSKNGIVVRSELNFGDMTRNEKRKMEIQLSNNGRESHTFSKVSTSMEVPGFVCKCAGNTLGNWLAPSMLIYPQEKKILPVEFTPVNLGRIEFSVIFSFLDGTQVGCVVRANVFDNLQNEIGEKGGTYKKPQTFLGRRVNSSNTLGSVLPGQRPVRKKKFFLPNKLAKYPIPSYLKECLVQMDGDVELLVPELNQPLHISNYRKKLSTLLYAEEIQMEQEMRQFDLLNVILRKSSEYLSLEVPGLAEGRPSLLLGDSVVISYSEKESSSRYEGFIHEIRAEDVLLKFCEEFHNSYQHEFIDVQFYFNRTSLRRAHQAIEHALNMGEESLFPTSIEEKEPLVNTENGVKPFNKNLNERQTKAVERILAASARPIPYVLFGPPGTGKSVTVVEAILQVLVNIKHSRILACAPSNSAADLIAERLHFSGCLKKHEMVRLNAFQRSKIGMPDCVEQYSVSDVDDLQFVSRHRIIVATCNMSGFLYSFNLRVGHFTHIFVDEAGQATEPECMIPVGFAVGSNESQVVLAGDPFQLGPVLRSDIAQDYGLNISLLERLCECPLYERDEIKYADQGSYNPLLVTKLVNNYRSHPKLLQLPSSIFYHRELVPCAEKSLVDVFLNSDIWPNGQCPFIFHGVRGDDFREGNSPSWFNPAEAVEVVKYVQRILRIFPIDAEDIGVITPYRKQVEKIRVLLDRFDLSDIKVGSVEEFQGQERQCIIISTVRSKEEFVEFDCHHNIGFLSNPKRFNVSITRAQALMVIIGNPIVLCYDPYWCAMIQYAIMNSAYIGCDLPPLNQPLVQESFRQALVLLGVNLQKSTGGNELEECADGFKVAGNENEAAVRTCMDNTENDKGNKNIEKAYQETARPQFDNGIVIPDEEPARQLAYSSVGNSRSVNLPENENSSNSNHGNCTELLDVHQNKIDIHDTIFNDDVKRSSFGNTTSQCSQSFIQSRNIPERNGINGQSSNLFEDRGDPAVNPLCVEKAKTDIICTGVQKKLPITPYSSDSGNSQNIRASNSKQVLHGRSNAFLDSLKKNKEENKKSTPQ